MAGKILHIDRDGKGLPGHSFCPTDTNVDHVCTKVYAKGFRNPFRFTLMSSGALFVGDVGWSSYEEINVITAGGKSYGWPCYEGPAQTPTWKDTQACKDEYAKGAGAHVGPTYTYQHTAEHPSWAVIAGPEYTGTIYPPEYRGRAFFGDFGAGFLKRMTFGPAGQAPAVADFATDWGSVDLTKAPNGDIAWVDLAGWATNAGFVERLVYSSANAKPTAVATASPTTGPAPLTVSFDGSASHDPNNDALDYDWDFDDGTVHATTAKPTHTYGLGTYTATLTVSDGRGLSDKASVVINAGNIPPHAPTIESPAAGFKYRDGVALTVRGSAADDDQGQLPASAFEWNVRIVHHDHEHLLSSPAGVKQFEVTPLQDHGADSYYVIEATVTDAHGATASAEREIHPETVPLHLHSQPPGAPLSFAGSAVTAPWDGSAAIGFLGTVSAAETFTSAGREWQFAGWSSGAERVHDLTVPDTETALTATYTSAAVPGGFPGGAPDRTGPVITARVGPRRRVLTGRVKDPAGVRSLRLAVAELEAGRCRWLGGSRFAIGRPRPCRPRHWVAAKLKGGRWALKLPRRLPVGRYRVWLRATDRLGNVTRRTADGHGHLSFTVEARASGRRVLAARRSANQLAPPRPRLRGSLVLGTFGIGGDHSGSLLGPFQSTAPRNLFLR
jgi:PKD domain/Glucose / Sorbosone dehydrogenase